MPNAWYPNANYGAPPAFYDGSGDARYQATDDGSGWLATNAGPEAYSARRAWMPTDSPPMRGRVPRFNPNAPQIGVPYSVGNTNVVARSAGPLMVSGQRAPVDPTQLYNVEQAPPVGVPQHAAHPGISPDMTDVAPSAPSPDAGGDIGMGIPMAAADAVTSTPIAEAAGAAAGMDTSGIGAALKAIGSIMGKRGGGGMAPPPPSARSYQRTQPEFIYTNPVAAQQAAARYHDNLAAESVDAQGTRDYMARSAESQAANARAAQQTDFQQQQLDRAQQEGQANRASAERIAGMNESIRQQRQADAEWQANERAAELGEQSAAMLNSDPNAKVDRKFAWINPATGKWESRFKRTPRPAPPAALGVPQGSQQAPTPPPGVAVPAPVASAGAPVVYPESDMRPPEDMAAAAPPPAASRPVGLPASTGQVSPEFIRRFGQTAPTGY